MKALGRKFMKTRTAFRFFLRFTIVLGLCACLLFNIAPAQADVAPPQQPPGANPQPGSEQTQVQMAAETVVISVQTTPFQANSSGENVVNDWAKVNVSFTMHNQGTADETMQVRFPLENPKGWGDGFGKYPLIHNFAVQVNGSPVNTTTVTTPNPGQASDPPVHWASFGVTFPVGQDVPIKVSYDLGASGYIPTDSFEYILETGAGWQGPIGSADLSLVLPYPASTDNVLIDDMSSFKGTFSGNKVLWHYDNLEPTSDDNLEVSIIQPGVWSQVVTAQAAVASQPNNGDAWGSLGRALKHALAGQKGFLRDDDGGKKLLPQAVQAYQKAISISPNEAQWHAGFAELLWSEYWSIDPRDNSYLNQSLQEIQHALQIDPANQQARTLADDIGSSFPGAIVTKAAGYDYLELTATLTPEVYDTSVPEATQAEGAAQQATLAPAPVEKSKSAPTRVAQTQPTPRPQITPIVAAKKTGNPPLPCCGSLLPVLLLPLWVLISHRRWF